MKSCKLQRSFFCIDFSKYRLMTNLRILCMTLKSIKTGFHANQMLLAVMYIGAAGKVVHDAGTIVRLRTINSAVLMDLS